MADDRQLDLFGEPAHPETPAGSPRWSGVAHHVPAHVRLGTSSWTFPGWRGLVYTKPYPSQRAFTRDSLAEYARHPLMRTVGIDRSHYAPLTAEDWGAYAAQLPDGFRCVIKAWDGITTLVYPDQPRYGDRRGTRNRDFLDPVRFRDEFAAPLLAGFAAHTGPLVLEVPPMRRPPPPRELENALERFLKGAPESLHYAVELRTPSLLTDRYLAILRHYAASHVFNFHTLMPPLAQQLDRTGGLPGPVAVARLMLPPYTGYAQRQRDLAPFDRIAEPQPGMRADVVRLAREAGELGHTLYVIAANKAEGCAPLTLAAIAELLAR